MPVPKVILSGLSLIVPLPDMRARNRFDVSPDPPANRIERPSCVHADATESPVRRLFRRSTLYMPVGRAGPLSRGTSHQSSVDPVPRQPVTSRLLPSGDHSG